MNVAPRELTQRELQIAELVTKGCSDKRIAAELKIAVPTVRAHLESISDKLGFGSAGSKPRQRIFSWYLRNQHGFDTTDICNGRHATTKRPFGLVYFIQARSGHIKIGLSADPYARLQMLQAACPIQLRLVGYTDGGRELERELHERFSAHRIRGEWFKPHPEIKAYIQSVCWHWPPTTVKHAA